MRHPIAKTVAATAIGIVVLAAVAAAAVPTVRHIASGWWNNPEGLAALPENPQVHYESGGSEQAHTVAALLPFAIARVEAAHGRRFAHPSIVGVYVTPESFVAANGLGSRRSVGMTFLVVQCCRQYCSPPSANVFRQCSRTSYLTHTFRVGFRNCPLCVCRSGSKRDLPSWFRGEVSLIFWGGGSLSAQVPPALKVPILTQRALAKVRMSASGSPSIPERWRSNSTLASSPAAAQGRQLTLTKAHNFSYWHRVCVSSAGATMAEIEGATDQDR
jgi:hypothetical protein